MRFFVAVVSLVLISCGLPEVGTVGGQEQPKTPGSKIVGEWARKPVDPVVDAVVPKEGSINSVIYLAGYRLYPGNDKTKAFFIQNGTEFPARTAGGWSRTNDLHNGSQTLAVIVPEEVALGEAQVVVEFEGRRSVPATITITPWQLPVVKEVIPKRGAPGTFVEVECEGFHVDDEIELTDEKGKPVTLNSGSSQGRTTIRIPEDAMEGVITIRIGNSKYGKGQLTDPVTFTVTNEPLPAELHASDTMSVAPGQWLDLQISNMEPLNRSERTEVAFKQAGRTIIVAAPKPFRPHFAVPSVLSAGEVELQIRTWRGGRPSEWSEPVSFELAVKPVAPMIDSIRLVKGSWAALVPGPDRKTSFTVSPGDEVVLNGLWPVADASKLKVSLVRQDELIKMTGTEFDEKANWFADMKVRLPESLAVGDWRMTVTSETDGTHVEVPIVIRVVQR
jgi:hypothetical protein